MKQIFRLTMRILAAALLALAIPVPSLALPQGALPPLSGSALMAEVQHRAVQFFWEKSDSATGLTNDRAHNIGGEDDYTVASVASTGYALASLPVAVTHHWLSRDQAYARALLTLRYVHGKLPNVHGWYYHFIDKHSGARVWNCELSSVDTSLLLMGALTAGEYWKGTEVHRLAQAIYDRVDWTWMRTNGGTQPKKLTFSMGWKPDTGFINSNWDHYCELMFIYLLALGSRTNPQPAECWRAWQRNTYTYKKQTTLAGGPIFMHQMAHAFYNFKGLRDKDGWDYEVSSRLATEMNRAFTIDLNRREYGPNIWGLNACDGPDGYNAYGVPGPEDGTVSTTGAIASIIFTPQLSKASADETYMRFGMNIWGGYGFSDSFNPLKNWFDKDVIGIDLGMALLAIEDVRTGLPWKLVAANPSTKTAFAKAGFHTTSEAEPRPLHAEPIH